MNYDEHMAELFKLAEGSNLLEHARVELDHWIKSDDEMSRMMAQNLLEMVVVFSLQGHSGFSGSVAISCIGKLLDFQPLRPLTGEDDEWTEVNPDGDRGRVFQNKRCGRIFKDKTGAYDIEGKVFREKDGLCYTSSDSRVYITFPYTPKTEYVDV